MLKRSSTMMMAIAVLVMATTSAAVAARGGTDRPFEARLSGQASWEVAEVCEGLNDLNVQTQTEGVGIATHMGKVVTSWRHCPTDEGTYVHGQVTITAANGDQLIGYYSDDGEDSIVIEEFEGTGRFTDASGRIEVFAEVTPQFDDDGPDFTVPWPWTATLTGSISY